MGFVWTWRFGVTNLGGQESDATFDCTSQNACKYWEIYTRCSKLRHLSISLQMANAFWCIIKIPLPDFRAGILEGSPSQHIWKHSTVRSSFASTSRCRAPELSLRSRPSQVSLRLLEKLRKVHPHIMSFLRVVLLREFSLLNAQITMESCVAIDT